MADFYATVMALLDELDLSTDIWTMPVEIPDAIPFDTDTEHASYDADAANRFWRAMVQSDRVMTEFRVALRRQVSPVHLFWGGLDLAVTRFSGRTRSAASGRGAELRTPCHVGGVLPRGEQLRLLARRRRRGTVLQLRLSGAERLPRRHLSVLPRPGGTTSSRSSSSTTPTCGPRRILMGCSWTSSSRPTRPRR